MKRPLKPEEKRLWADVAATVRLAPGRTPPERPSKAQGSALTPAQAVVGPIQPPQRAHLDPRSRGNERKNEADKVKAPGQIEPLRRRRLVRARDEIEARLDLHGLDQDRARSALHAFLRRAHEHGMRAVLVITGKGTLGDGILRRRTPDWLAEPAVRPLIAGVSPAARHHGGEGALYIALKRRK
jgi:DNA-nicking Smr family endonuclease